MLQLLLVLPFWFAFIIKNAYIYTGRITLLGKENTAGQLMIDLYRWATGFAGTITTVLISQKIYLSYKRVDLLMRVVSLIGRFSIYIYIMDDFINNHLLMKISSGFQPPFLVWCCETIITITVLLFVSNMMSKNRLTSSILFGGR